MKEQTFWERFNASLANQEQLIASTEYFDWLYEFTKKRPKFTTTDWMYKKDRNMSEKDYSQVDLLTDFFTAIDGYHRENLLGANAEGYAAWYNLKYNDAYFAIGIRVGQGAENFVTRYKNYKEMNGEPYIEFEDIMQNRVAAGFVEKQKALEQLEVAVKHACSVGVPKDAVEKAIKKAFDKK